jgi:hypothetical protein
MQDRVGKHTSVTQDSSGPGRSRSVDAANVDPPSSLRTIATPLSTLWVAATHRN